jgi:hypothetical protein
MQQKGEWIDHKSSNNWQIEWGGGAVGGWVHQVENPTIEK